MKAIQPYWAILVLQCFIAALFITSFGQAKPTTSVDNQTRFAIEKANLLSLPATKENLVQSGHTMPVWVLKKLYKYLLAGFATRALTLGHSWCSHAEEFQSTGLSFSVSKIIFPFHYFW